MKSRKASTAEQPKVGKMRDIRVDLQHFASEVLNYPKIGGKSHELRKTLGGGYR